IVEYCKTIPPSARAPPPLVKPPVLPAVLPLTMPEESDRMPPTYKPPPDASARVLATLLYLMCIGPVEEKLPWTKAAPPRAGLFVDDTELMSMTEKSPASAFRSPPTYAPPPAA